MKRSMLFLIAAGLAVAALLVCISPRTAMADDSRSKKIETMIANLEQDWVAAIVHKDTEMLDLLLASDYNGTSPTGMTYSKEMAIAEINSGTYDVREMNLGEISVNVYGNTAVAFMTQDEKSKYGTEDFSGRYHYTDVWVKRGGRWQVVASHGSGSEAFPSGEDNPLPSSEDVTMDNECP
jgi:ketosteroid isomerase-like protein